MKSGRRIRVGIAGLIGAIALGAGLRWGGPETRVEAAEPRVAPGKVVYNRDVRPLLSDNCFHCHGPDKSHRKAKLRFDKEEAATEKKAIVPGHPEQSEL